MNDAAKINVSEVIDHSRVGPFQILVLALCGMCLVMDGFDVQAMAYAAPAVIKEWHIDKSALGPVFGAGLLGMLIGSLCFGVAADKLGRRPVLLAATLFLAVAMFLSAKAASVHQLLVLRLVTGFAMGAIVPNAVALAGEFSPARFRVTLMMIVSSGFIVGGAVGGAVSSLLIPTFGWQSVFYAGAIAPLVIGLFMVAGLPESLQFQVLRARRLDKARLWLRRLDPACRLDSASVLVVNEATDRRTPLIALFRHGAARGTALLWVINFMNMLAAYFLSAWLPAVMNGAGYSASQAVWAGTALWLGGVVGNLTLGWLVDRRGFGPVLLATFLTAGVAIASISRAYSLPALAFAVIAVAGFCVLGGQSALNALAATFYPTAARSTGLGCALGVGRLGAILGPVIGGALMSLGWTTESLFLTAAIPVLFAMIATFAFWRGVPLTVPGGRIAGATQEGAFRQHRADAVEPFME
ncbi:MFS transporter [Cupriavidus sp. CV2]|uniref:MFS transporter n=1 Tax=Cupriavidus ulmosensis TaxID=3065913 RepID=UPI00296B279E|nr:MFS transporter [Cupriavidus sp. CV2]MDW3686002.1 MFS transporter [Cupriavidus sp. CV2]